jgi:predicted HAD superfamily Cof-like phosphohydrolase
MEKSNFAKIEDFQRAAGAVRPLVPTVPSAESLKLRLQLIREEYEEVSEAVAALTAVSANGSKPDVTQLVHELADLLYVVYGTFSSCGVDADAVFAEVHRANMEKIGGPRRADGKLLKPPGWQPADVKGVLAQMGSD